MSENIVEESTNGGVDLKRLEPKRKVKLSRLRRFFLLAIIILFLLQFLRIKFLVGGLTGSLVLWTINLVDVFAYLESLSAAKSFTLNAFWSLLPVLGLYLLFGRAFCGWVCPLDFFFEFVGRRRFSILKSSVVAKVPTWLGYLVLLGFLLVSFLSEVPVFTTYLSHLTNFFRFLTGFIFLILDLPLEPAVISYSGLMLFLLIFLEFLAPRLWCRVLCPIGKVYGLFNKVSLLRLKFREGTCGECALCDQVCYMGVKIAQNIDKPSLRDTNCIYCGRCVEGCDTRGKLIQMSLRR